MSHTAGGSFQVNVTYCGRPMASAIGGLAASSLNAVCTTGSSLAGFATVRVRQTRFGRDLAGSQFNADGRTGHSAAFCSSAFFCRARMDAGEVSQRHRPRALKTCVREAVIGGIRG